MNDTIDPEKLRGRGDREFPALYQLFGGYFHQDWKLEYPDWPDAIEAFRVEAPPHLREDAVSDVARLLTSGLDDSGLDRMLYPVLECNFVPSARSMTSRTWLEAIAQSLTQPR